MRWYDRRNLCIQIVQEDIARYSEAMLEPK